MPKTVHKQPSNAYVVHYKDLEGLTPNVRPPVQQFCRDLTEKGIKGQLWIYDNRDKDCEYLPDVIYPIKQAGDNANSRFLQIGIHYGKTKGVVWGLPGQ